MLSSLVKYGIKDKEIQKMWPTPQSRDHFPAHTKEAITKQRKAGHGCRNLNDEVMMWPTPNVPNRGPERREAKKDRGSGGVDLQTAVKMFPTPDAQMAKHAEPTDWEKNNLSGYNKLHVRVNGQLNPTWVEWLMGFPLGWTDLNAWATP